MRAFWGIRWVLYYPFLCKWLLMAHIASFGILQAPGMNDQGGVASKKLRKVRNQIMRI